MNWLDEAEFEKQKQESARKEISKNVRIVYEQNRSVIDDIIIKLTDLINRSNISSAAEPLTINDQRYLITSFDSPIFSFTCSHRGDLSIMGDYEVDHTVYVNFKGRKVSLSVSRTHLLRLQLTHNNYSTTESYPSGKTGVNPGTTYDHWCDVSADRLTGQLAFDLVSWVAFKSNEFPSEIKRDIDEAAASERRRLAPERAAAARVAFEKSLRHALINALPMLPVGAFVGFIVGFFRGCSISNGTVEWGVVLATIMICSLIAYVWGVLFSWV
jgi:type III secretory pathway component EscS